MTRKPFLQTCTGSLDWGSLEPRSAHSPSKAPTKILGLSVAERRPEWLYPYIGAGRVIDMQVGERNGYKFDLETARKVGEVQALG